MHCFHKYFIILDVFFIIFESELCGFVFMHGLYYLFLLTAYDTLQCMDV